MYKRQGYIGSHTCVELQNAGYDVVVLDNLSNASEKSLDRVEALTGKKVTFYKGDILDRDILNKIFAEQKIDSCIHFAGLKAVGESVAKPWEYYNNNIAGTLSLIHIFMDTKIDFKDPAYYENRELSWIKFDQRVLSEARDKSIPLLERLKFVSITSSNLDEFFMVRVASLKDMVHAKYKKRDIAGMTATEQLSAINKQARELVNIQYSTFSRSLMPLLRKEGIYLLDAHEDLNEEQARFVDRYFMENVYPVLTPMAVDASRPFPLIRNKTLNIAAVSYTHLDVYKRQMPDVRQRFL